MAQQEAVAKLSAMDAGAGVGAVAQVLGARSPSSARRSSKDDVLFARGWCWPTEGDATARARDRRRYMVEGKLIPKPLAWSQVRDAFAPAAPLPVKAAYDKMGRSPTRRVQARTDAQGPARRARVGSSRSWKDRT